MLYVYNNWYVLCFLVECLLAWLGWEYIYNWYVLCFSIDCLLAWLRSNQANRQSIEKQNTYQFLYTYSVPPDDGLQILPKHVEVD